MSAVFLLVAIVAVLYAIRCRSKIRYARRQIAEAQMYLNDVIEMIEEDEGHTASP